MECTKEHQQSKVYPKEKTTTAFLLHTDKNGNCSHEDKKKQQKGIYKNYQLTKYSILLFAIKSSLDIKIPFFLYCVVDLQILR